ncbi:hypothetical protein KGF56_004921 [Candida oxycetoniae]|uniref:Uncharacterized protein n=1 Tax=Candida oxycetoniae TaxID=497107 RepID=A0AAI9STI5_9ASCO|nr:uncharacterized protein KGF56_004921 [Candida oxycetoniae]KAI3402351.1 hypothetical protein KGF56_004921 [Candida oxycetoniae]
MSEAEQVDQLKDTEVVVVADDGSVGAGAGAGVGVGETPNLHVTESPPIAESTPVKANSKSKPKKSVGFAPPPEEDLREHHRYLKEKEEDELKSSSFHKIPPELAYLNQKTRNAPAAPKPLDSPLKHQVPNSRLRLSDLPDLSKLKFFDVKDISVQNKETELQFHYTTINLPPRSDSVIVDIKYSSLNSFDLSKINQYLLNLSNVKVGLGYEFAGVITQVGSSMSKKYSVEDYVFGMIDPDSKRGALSTSQIIYPGRDVLIKVDKETLQKLDEIDINLDGNMESKDFQVGEGEVDGEEEEQEEQEEEPDKDVPAVTEDISQTNKLSLNNSNKNIPSLAKLSAISLLYCRSKQMLQHFESESKKVNVLINGADTDIGLTLTQILLSETRYDFISLILIIREKSQTYMERLIEYFQKKYYDPSQTKRIKCISFDMLNDGLYFPGERIPTNYKKPDFFAVEVINALLTPHTDLQESINESNINNYKLDLFIDLIGCKKYFQSTTTKLHEIETLNFPYKQHIGNTTSVEKLFQATSKIPFLARILKPKKLKSVVISGCKFTLREPSYNIDKLIDFNEQGIMNPWNKGWTSNLFNNWTSYNYYEEIYLKIKQSWCEEALSLVVNDRLKFKIDHVVDWRKEYKKYIQRLKENDGKIIFQVEDF